MLASIGRLFLYWSCRRTRVKEGKKERKKEMDETMLGSHVVDG